MVVGNGGFADAISNALLKIGFRDIIIRAVSPVVSVDMVADLVMDRSSTWFIGKLPVVYPFDFIDGGAAVVDLPEDSPKFEVKDNVRLYAAKYMSGYCAFWNIVNSEWLHDLLYRIERGEQSAKAQQTAASICAGIMANIAVGRNVKHFPRFYLSRNLE